MIQKKSLLKWSFIITIFGCSQFLVLTSLSMIFYSGGNHDDYYAPHYDFFHNVFSDLGRSVTFLNESNLVSQSLFTTALTIVGVSLICYFISLPFLFSNEKNKWLIIIGSINGVINAINYMGIGFAPYDLYHSTHVWFVYIAFTSSILTGILYSIAFFYQRIFPKFYAWIYLIFTLLLIGYLLILFNGFGLFNANWMIQVIGQKIIVYSEIICFLIQGIGGLLEQKGRYQKQSLAVETQVLTINE